MNNDFGSGAKDFYLNTHIITSIMVNQLEFINNNFYGNWSRRATINSYSNGKYCRNNCKKGCF